MTFEKFAPLKSEDDRIARERRRRILKRRRNNERLDEWWRAIKSTFNEISDE